MTVKEAFANTGAFLRKYGKIVTGIALAILGVVLAVEAWKGIRVLIGKVQGSSKVPWVSAGCPPGTIAIQVPSTKALKSLTLPEGVAADSIKSVGYDQGNRIVTVEVTHEVVDRRNVTPRAGSARDVLAGRKGNSSSGNG
jgi:hypothetical protein